MISASGLLFKKKFITMHGNMNVKILKAISSYEATKGTRVKCWTKQDFILSHIITNLNKMTNTKHTHTIKINAQAAVNKTGEKNRKMTQLPLCLYFVRTLPDDGPK
jgi:hypothetical protein